MTFRDVASIALAFGSDEAEAHRGAPTARSTNMKVNLNKALGLAALSLHCLHSPAQQASQATNQPSSAALARLQGIWRGSMIGDKATDNITITVSNNSLTFHRDTNFWFETVILLPPSKNPEQLHATIQRAAPSQSDAIGKVVAAIFKVEEGILTLATAGEVPENFEDENASRYKFRKIEPPERTSEQPGRIASKERDKDASK